MGLSFSFAKLFSAFRKDARILMLGLDAAGKTTCMYKLQLGEVVQSIPTIGFNVETLEYKSLTMQMWDVGGQDKIRKLWRHYYRGTHALIYVVDSHDRDRVALAREELHAILSADEMPRDACVLVFANKQDLPGALPPTEVAEALGLHKMRDREWYIQGSCTLTGEGLHEGMDWLVPTVSKRL